MRRFIRKFIRSDDGATTVDWVVLTALAMSLCLAAFYAVESGTQELTTNVSDTVSTRPIDTTFE